MASDRLNKRHASAKRPRETSSLIIDDSSFMSPIPTSSTSRPHHLSSRSRALPTSSPASSSSSHSVHSRMNPAPDRRTPTRSRASFSSPSDPSSHLLECSRCGHLFPSPGRLLAHHNRKQRCHPNDHLRSPVSSGQSSPSSAALSAASSPSSATRRWSRHSRTGLPRFNADAYALSLLAASADAIRLGVHRRHREERLDPARLSSDYVCHANEAVVLKLIRQESELGHEFGSFHPSFTHQLFPDEDIVGYKRLTVHCDFTAGSLFAHLQVQFDEKVKHGSDDVFQQIAGKLPPDAYTTDIEAFKKHIGEDFTPPGVKVCEYIVPSVDSSKDAVVYEIYKGSFSSPGMKAYHARLQFFLLFFIDRSSFINDSDLLWEVLLLMERRVARHSSAVSYAVVGYTTLYKFLSYPSDWRLRLSQILILPPYQRCGHGAKLLQFVYEEAARRRFSEVNIEDPAPVFQFLRDLTDVSNCRKRGLYQKQASEMLEGPGGLCAAWDAEYARSVQRALRIPLKQVRRCYEIFKLSQTDVRQSRQYDQYRLEVKRRLYVEREEALCTAASGEERKEMLHDMYAELEQHYLAVVRKARIH